MTDKSDCESAQAAQTTTKPARDAALRHRAEELLMLRNERYAIFGRAMFGEPAWDMLLILYAADPDSSLTVSKLASLAGASKSTGLRWLRYLESQRLVCRDPHEADSRAEVVELTQKGVETIESYFRTTSANIR